MIELSKTLSLPVDAVTQTFGILSKKGSGKSYTATKLAEGMLKVGGQIIAFDPVGNWFNLRMLADGTPSGLPVYIFGGTNADIPIDPQGGRELAKVLANEPISAVLDVSEMRQGEMRRFAAAFADEFYHQKKSNRTPVHLFLEEAQLFVPQDVKADTAAMVGAFELIVRLGRNYGIGATMISQRPQSVNKQVLSQVECLIVLQTNGVHERKAIEEWVSEHGVERGMVGELPSLPVGTAYVWSPSWLRVFEKVQIAKKFTFDGSATPTVGQTPVEPKRLAPTDLAKLREVMAEAFEEAQSTDPKHLQERIKQLELQLKSKPVAVLAHAPSQEEIKAAFDQGVTTERHRVANELGILAPQYEAIADAGETITGLIAKLSVGLVSIVSTAKVEFADPRVTKRIKSETLPGGLAVSQTKSYGARPRPQQAILDGLAWLEAIGLTSGSRTIVAFLAGASPKSSAFVNNLGGLRTSSLIAYPGPGMVALSATGRQCASAIDAPKTPAALHHMIAARLPKPQFTILSVLIQCRGPISREQLAARAGASPNSSAYVNNLGALRSLGLIDYPTRGDVVALPILFLRGS